MNNNGVSYSYNNTIQDALDNSREDSFNNFKNQYQSSNLPDSLYNEQQEMQQIEEMKEEFFVSGGESLLTKMGGMLIAKAFLPTGSHIKEALAYLDIAIKTELVLNELSSTLFYFSFLELFLFIASMLFFFTDPTEMAWIWFHTPHIARGILGLLLMKKMPKSHQMAANMSIPQDDKMPFDAIMRYILLAARDALKDFTQATKKQLAYYLGVTVLCLFLDLTTFFIQVKNFAQVQSAFADLTLIVVSSIFLFIDWFYIMWLVSLSYKFPSYIATSFIKGFFGLMEQINQKLGDYLRNKRDYYDQHYRVDAQRYSYTSNQQSYASVIQQQQQIGNYPRPQLNETND